MRICLAGVMITVILMMAPMDGATQSSLPAGEMRLGASFSQQQCDYLGLEWKEVYEEVTSMDFEFLRLGAYWSRIEKEKGKFDFSELDWQMQMAAEKKIRVLLTVGMKAPRWPEYYLPQWLTAEIKVRKGANIAENELVRTETLRFIRAVVNRYQAHEALYAWQIENEPLYHSGPFNWRIGRDFLEKEISLVQELDGKDRPLVVNSLTMPNTFLRVLSRLRYKVNPILETIDVAGVPAFNIYPVIGHKWLFFRFCFQAWRDWMVSYMRSVAQKVHEKGKKAWVTELQAEPWEPGKLVHLEKDKKLVCPVQSYAALFKELQPLHFEVVFFWGVEYWYLRKTRYADPSWMNVMQEVIPPHPAEPLP